MYVATCQHLARYCQLLFWPLTGWFFPSIAIHWRGSVAKMRCHMTCHCPVAQGPSLPGNQPQTYRMTPVVPFVQTLNTIPGLCKYRNYNNSVILARDLRISELSRLLIDTQLFQLLASIPCQNVCSSKWYVVSTPPLPLVWPNFLFERSHRPPAASPTNLLYSGKIDFRRYVERVYDRAPTGPTLSRPSAFT